MVNDDVHCHQTNVTWWQWPMMWQTMNNNICSCCLFSGRTVSTPHPTIVPTPYPPTSLTHNDSGQHDHDTMQLQQYHSNTMMVDDDTQPQHNVTWSQHTIQCDLSHFIHRHIFTLVFTTEPWCVIYSALTCTLWCIWQTWHSQTKVS